MYPAGKSVPYVRSRNADQLFDFAFPTFDLVHDTSCPYALCR